VGICGFYTRYYGDFRSIGAHRRSTHKKVDLEVLCLGDQAKIEMPVLLLTVQHN
jgi:hypothetical protein